HGIQDFDQVIGGPAFAFDASNSCRAAADVHLHDSFTVAEDFVQVSNGTYVRISWVAAAHACRVGHHGLELLANDRLRISQQDCVPVRLRHLAAIGAGQFGGGSKKGLRLGKYRHALALVEQIESARDLTSQFDVRDLVFADGNKVALVNQNVGGLQHWVTQKTVRPKVFFGDVFALLLVGRDTFQPA